MTVKDFISGYTRSKDKDAYPSKHLKTKYIPYQEKIARCQKIVDNTMYVKVLDKKMFKINSPAQYLNFCMVLIDLYYDIDISFGEGILDEFNALNELQLIDELMKNIPEHEYSEFNTVLHMVIDDVISNERDIVSYLETKVGAIELMLKGIQDALPVIEEEQ